MKHSIFFTIKISLELEEKTQSNRERTLIAHELNDALKRTGRTWKKTYKHSDTWTHTLKNAKRKLIEEIQILTGFTPVICKTYGK